MDKIAKLRALGFTEDEIDKFIGIASRDSAENDKVGMACIERPSYTNSFTHLHVHTDYSILDGMCKIPELIGRAVDMGMPAVAMTDHGNMSGAIEFYQAAKRASIKPIIGCEVYYVPDMHIREHREMWHLVLLAKDSTGYKNLMKITTAGYTDGFHYKPRVDLELVGRYSGGLIAMTACVKGYVPAMLLTGNADEAGRELGRLKDIFGGDLYIEVMDHGLPEQTQVNPELMKLGRELDIPVLATNDCHYINADDYTAHDVLLCIQTGKTLADSDRLRFGSNQFYFKTPQEMAMLFPEEYLSRTLEVAEKCDLELDFTSRMPRFTTPDGLAPEDYLWQRIQEGIQERYDGEIDPDRVERLRSEFDVIKRTGFASYFLIIDDMIQFARRRGIRVGPGRGSAVASLVCYVLSITDVDPITHELMFERFLTEDRVSPPDIDVDFRHDRRSEVIEYFRSRYGYATQIVTFGSLMPRSLIRKVGKVLGADPMRLDAVAKRIPKYAEDTLSELSNEIQQLSDLDPQIIELGTKLHGIISEIGKHAAGIVVSNEPLTNLIPLQISKEMELSQYNKDSLEDCGMLKLDALSCKFLTIISMTLEQVSTRHDIGIQEFPINDTPTYDLICSGELAGIFQLSKECGRGLVMKMQPRTFEDLCQLISIGRPGVIDSGLANQYFNARETGDIKYLHQSLEPILNETLGVILYQEQIMKIAVGIAGFSWTDADKLRKAISKKDHERMTSLQAQFVTGCTNNGIADNIAMELWQQIEYFGGYGFNKAHAAGYARFTYQTAYLKAHYPLEYYASLISIKADDADNMMDYIFEARRHGIEILTPDINVSTDKCIIADDSIILQLTAVSYLGEKACAAIIAERRNGKFESYADFCGRTEGSPVNIRVRKNLVKAGAFDSLCPRSELIEAVIGNTASDELAMEREVLGLYVSGHPLDDFDYSDGTIRIGEVSNLPIGSEFKTVGIVSQMKEHTDRNGGVMAFVTIEDGRDSMEFVIFSSVYNGDLNVNSAVHIQGRLDETEPLKAIAIEYEIIVTQDSNLVSLMAG